MLWALVPAKLGPAVKSRLGAALSPEQRRALAQAMLCDVLAALTSAPALAGVAVVTRDPSVASLATGAGATPIEETHAGGLNDGVAQGIAACRARGASGVVIVMGDLPNLLPSDVERTVAALPERGVVLVPSRDGTGTNVLAARPADLVLPTRFGEGSLAHHRAATAALDRCCCRCAARRSTSTPRTTSSCSCATEPPVRPRGRCSRISRRRRARSAPPEGGAPARQAKPTSSAPSACRSTAGRRSPPW